jgi:ATP-binding cassette subfamily G (WHITE) protein 2 (PDR)
MLGWARWINYINPVAYAFEAVMASEFSGRQFPCPPHSLVPSYGELPNQICGVVGSLAGQDFVSGDVYLDVAFKYYVSNKWRNVGIMIAFTFVLLCTYLVAAELVSPKKSRGEVLVFQRGQTPAALTRPSPGDLEGAGESPVRLETQSTKVPAAIQRQTAIFQ